LSWPHSWGPDARRAARVERDMRRYTPLRVLTRIGHDQAPRCGPVVVEAAHEPDTRKTRTTRRRSDTRVSPARGPHRACRRAPHQRRPAAGHAVPAGAGRHPRRPAVAAAAPGRPAGPGGDCRHGTNSWSPRPSSSLLLASPDAMRRMCSKIAAPISRTVTVPSRTSPQLMSMSSSSARTSACCVASLIDGTGLAPNIEPRPVVKQIRLAPPAIWPVAEHRVEARRVHEHEALLRHGSA
jgi:hypothetical protein